MAERLARGPVEPQTAFSILEDLLVALEPVHAGGAIHGRITPAVIHLTDEGEIGAAESQAGKKSGRWAAELKHDAVSDDPGYLAPEQLSGRFIDARSDVFALGVVAYEMLVGRNPFCAGEGPQPGAVCYEMVRRPSRELSDDLPTGLPDHARRAVGRAMTAEAESRFPDAGSFLRALQGQPWSGQTRPRTVVEVARDLPDSSPFWEAFAEWLEEARRNLAAYLVTAILVAVGLIAVLLAILR